MRLARAILCITLLLLPASALAKKVSVEWKEIKGAARYEIQIERDGNTVVKKMVDDTSWDGKLDFGVYAYQIRAYDKVKRPGSWSVPKPLVVMPSPPDLVSPDGGKTVFYGHESKATFKWKEVQGVEKYVLDVKNDDQSVFHETVEGTQFEVPHLKPGNYTWNVVAVVEAKGRHPANFTGKKWESQPSAKNSFRMVQDQLEAPKLVAPDGKIKPPAQGRLTFKWSPVTGAEAYEVHVIEVEPKGRSVASRPETVITTKSNNVVATLAGEGKYRWQVRALAAIDENKVPDAVGPVSQSEFEVDRNAEFFEGSGYVALSEMLAPYNYQVMGYNGMRGGGGSSGFTTRASGEYWFKPQLGAAIGFDHTVYGLSESWRTPLSNQMQSFNATYGRNDLALELKYRANVTKDKYAWYFSPKVGLLVRDNRVTALRSYNDLQPYDDGFSTIGPTFGFDLRKQLSDKLSLGIKFAYFYPVHAGGGAQLTTANPNNRNFGVGAQALYWLNLNWGLGAGIYHENRSVSVISPGNPTAMADTVTMDGSYFFGSLLYSFGR